MNIWEGIYENWEEISAKRSAFCEKRWIEAIGKQLIDYNKEKKEFGIAIPPRPTNLPIVCALLNIKKIIDFGGSSGWNYEYMKDVVHNIDLEIYDVIELKEINIVFKNSNFRKPEEIIKHLSIDEIKNNYDLLYINSALQYFKDNTILEKLINISKAKYLLFDDLFAGDIPDYITIQKYYDSSIPIRFMNFTKFNSFLSHINYRILFEMPYYTKFFGSYMPQPMSNFPKRYRIRYSKSILYESTI